MEHRIEHLQKEIRLFLSSLLYRVVSVLLNEYRNILKWKLQKHVCKVL